jgi:hypothetical protein
MGRESNGKPGNGKAIGASYFAVNTPSAAGIHDAFLFRGCGFVASSLTSGDET